LNVDKFGRKFKKIFMNEAEDPWIVSMMDKKKLFLLMYFAGARGEKDKEELY
jgi:hypothetical protein